MTDRELMQQALEALELAYAGIDAITVHGKAITALKERLAQPQRTHWEGCEEVHPECRQQEPVAWVTGWHDGHCVIRAADPALMLPIGAALYTTPPRREWVGLTDDELWDLWNSYTEEPFPEWFVDFKKAYEVIEAKLKEKNT